MIFAHGSGWDELAIFVSVPVLFWLFLKLTGRRAARHARRDDAGDEPS